MAFPGPGFPATPTVEPLKQDPFALVDETADLSLVVGDSMVIGPTPYSSFHPVQNHWCVWCIEVVAQKLTQSFKFGPLPVAPALHLQAPALFANRLAPVTCEAEKLIDR